ncbi:MAG: hypothetical protein WC677_03255 [Clostridia bacterium]
MKNYINGALKVLIGYAKVVGVYIIFFAAIFKSFQEKNIIFAIYSAIMLVILVLIIYSDNKRLAIKEKKSHSTVPCYPLKGLVLGFIGFSPVILLELIYPFITLNNQGLNDIKQLVLNTFMAPLYPIYKSLNEMPVGYFLASLVVPAIAMIGYLAGYYGFRVKPISKARGENFDNKITKVL